MDVLSIKLGSYRSLVGDWLEFDIVFTFESYNMLELFNVDFISGFPGNSK